jgi:endonuclease/exonuclease/phosphatase family metal-dependent hydrolase
MHLDLSGLWRSKQAAAIVALAKKYGSDEPTTMMGDLNEWRAHGGRLSVFGQSFDFARCARSFHVRRPVARLDRIMFSDHWQEVDSGVHISPASRKVSDHYPVWAELELK